MSVQRRHLAVIHLHLDLVTFIYMELNIVQENEKGFVHLMTLQIMLTDIARGTTLVTCLSLLKSKV